MKKLLFVAVAAASLAGLAGEFKAGFARVDITPPLGSYMPGYYVERYAKKVLDPLEINMVAFSDGEKTALVAQIDTEGISDSVADAMRDAIVKATKVDRDAILLHASHTHDGGYLAMRSTHGSNADKPGDGLPSHATPIDVLYVDHCVTRAADAAVNAIADLKPAKLAVGKSVAKRISFGRRYLMKDGKVRTNPGTNNPDIVKPVGTADDTVQVLRVDREGGKAICVINFQTHPDVVGGETLTADWPGLTRTVFEAATFGDTQCLVLNGTQGDVNHCNVMPRPGELNGLTRDFDDVDRGYDHAKHMANVLAASALSVWMKCESVEAGAIRFGVSNVEVGAHKAKDTDAKNLAWANEIWALHEAGKDAEISKRLGCYGMELTTEIARAGRIRNMAKFGDTHKIPIDSIAIGKSVAFGGFPGEPFNDIGVNIRKGSPFKLTMLSCLTNGSRGYFPYFDDPTAKSSEEGYEAATTPFVLTVGQTLVEGELALLRELAK